MCIYKEKIKKLKNKRNSTEYDFLLLLLVYSAVEIQVMLPLLLSFVYSSFLLLIYFLIFSKSKQNRSNPTKLNNHRIKVFLLHIQRFLLFLVLSLSFIQSLCLFYVFIWSAHSVRVVTF